MLSFLGFTRDGCEAVKGYLMKNTFGNNISVTLAGESHGAGITVIIDGIKPGAVIDESYISSQLALRRPGGSISTARREADAFSVTAGMFEGKATGTPICIFIPNSDAKSGDYEKTKFLCRPGHADFTANEKYHGFQDYRGGGHFSGRITAGLVAAGAICRSVLQNLGIAIGTHIAAIAGVSDRQFGDLCADIKAVSEMSFPVLDAEAGEKMRERINQAAAEGDSVGGILETAVIGMPSGIGEPWFDSCESLLSHILFSVPGIKGVEFGAGFGFADMRGSLANDPFRCENGRTVTAANRSGGINGGITNGMPLLFRCAVRPTPSIAKEQETVSLETGENAVIAVKGRHDPCIVHRAASVVTACTAIALLDMLAGRYGTDLAGLGSGT